MASLSRLFYREGEKSRKMNQQQFEQIARTMERRYGKIKKGDEERFAMMLFPMESNLMKVWRNHPDSNSRRLDEAILLALHTVKSRTDEDGLDFHKYETVENKRLKEALLAAFDPAENEEIQEAVKESGVKMEGKEEVFEYYRVPVMCMLRIRDSVQHWSKEMGSDGYFKFLSGYLGDKVPFDNKMNYSIIKKV